MSDPTDCDWAALRHAFEVGTTVTELARGHGVSRTAIYRRARAEDWQRRPVSAGAACEAKSKSKAAPRPTRAKPKRGKPASRASGLHKRLISAINMQLDQLETRMSDPSDMSSADYERETRALGALVRNFEKLIGMKLSTKARKGTARDGRSNGPRLADDPDAFREEVAARILSLRERLDGVARGPDGRAE
ncbi:MAG: hypothetical protein AAFV26_02110 [Pseudomonadota bacterium]